MTNATSYVQVPPQSTGRKVATTSRTEIFYDQNTGVFTAGMVVVGATSGATGVVTANQTEGYVVGAGKLYLTDNSGTWINNENIEVASIVHAAVDFSANPQQTVDVQKMVLTDADNLERTQKIDRFGATVNTFTEGAPIFGPFNSLQTGTSNTIKEYAFAIDDQPADFYTDLVGAGTSTFNVNRGLSQMACSTATGDLAKRTTHYYHSYAPGHGTQLMASIQIGDAGKANVRRRWGYYSDFNGIFFELDGTNLYVVIRSNATGSIVDERTLQSDWNVDTCDGADAIGFDLDVSKPNIYWIDFQWLGAGTVRFGVYESEGSRILAHVAEHSNTDGILPYMRNASLPFRYEQENIGTAVSSSEMFVNCAVVMHTGTVLQDGIKYASDSGVKTITEAAGEVPIMSIRPKQTFGGQPNHSVWKGISYTLANITNTGGSPVIFRIRSGLESLLTGEVFVSHLDASIAEIDTTATAVNPLAKVVGSTLLVADESRVTQNIDPRELHTFEIYLYADDLTQPCLIITAECVSATSADVFAAVNWEELL
jgi:hypothetical protein